MIVDIILGQSVLVEKPMETGDDIIGVCFAKELDKKGQQQQQQELVTVFNSKNFRLFSTKGGDHVGGQKFPLGLSEVLGLRFFADVANFASVHWCGDQVMGAKSLHLLVTTYETRM